MLSISTDKSEYAPGEQITAELRLSLDKPVKARGIFAALTCTERKIVKTTRIKSYDDQLREKELGIPGATNLITSTSEESSTFFEQERKLADEREYRSETFKLVFQLPQNAPPTSREFGHDSKIHIWKISAKLDIPFAPDKNAEKEIFVSGLG